MSKKQLAHIDIIRPIFNVIMQYCQGHIEVVDDFSSYIYGTSPNYKRMIYSRAANGNEYMVIPVYLLKHFVQVAGYDRKSITHEGWKQVIIHVVEDTTGSVPVTSTVSGSYAYNYIMMLIKKHLTVDQIRDRLHQYSAEYDLKMIQQHYQIQVPVMQIKTFENCVHYDINGAHADALMEIFPEAKEDLMELNERKIQAKKNGNIAEANRIKAIFNYCVGQLVNKGYRGTYNWIVQRTTSIIKKLETEVYDANTSRLIYVNTDGLIIQNPKKKIETSSNIGDFKLECEGTVKVLQTNNYWIYQDAAEIKGSLPLELRNKVDLFQGRYVTFKKKRVFLDEETKAGYFTYTDVKEITNG